MATNRVPAAGGKPPRIFLGAMSRIDLRRATDVDTFLCQPKAPQIQRKRPKTESPGAAKYSLVLAYERS